MANALSIAPHHDDIALGAGGSILRLTAAGWAVRFVYLTDSRYSVPHLRAEEAVELRVKEAAEERGILGVKDSPIQLGFEDGTLVCLDATETQRVIEALADILVCYRPDVVLCPAAGEAHPDHFATYNLVVLAAGLAGLKPLLLSFLVWQLPFSRTDSLDVGQQSFKRGDTRLNNPRRMVLFADTFPGKVGIQRD